MGILSLTIFVQILLEVLAIEIRQEKIIGTEIGNHSNTVSADDTTVYVESRLGSTKQQL